MNSLTKLKPYIKLIFIVVLFVTTTKKTFSQYTEYEVKAAYIFSFVKFIEWENIDISKSDTIVLGIYKNDPFGEILERIMLGRKSNGKFWKIIRFNKIADVDKCNIVFLSGIDKYELGIILKRISKKPILSIGDEIPDFCEIGGILNFTPQYSDNQFEINNKLANKNGIKINPKLLKLAKIVSYNEDEF